ncbi:unnamed protein product, partial [Rotaria sordida]
HTDHLSSPSSSSSVSAL